MKNLREVYQVIITLFLLLSLLPQVCSPNSSRLAQGQALYERGNFPAAIELWRREIEEDAETSPTAKLALAQAYLDLGNLVAATQLSHSRLICR